MFVNNVSWSITALKHIFSQVEYQKNVHSLRKNALFLVLDSRYIHLQTSTKIADNDALWDVIIALEYQRSFYENIPNEIDKKLQNFLDNLATITKKKTNYYQNQLTENSFGYKESHFGFLYKKNIVFGIFFLILLIIYNSFLLLLGYCMSIQKMQPWFLLNMPVGVVIGGLCFLTSMMLGIMSAKAYANGDKTWYRYTAATFVVLVVGTVVLGNFFGTTLSMW